MIDKEVMQMALDALEKHVDEYEAIKALRAALAQPEKEWVELTDEEAKKTFEKHKCIITAELAGILARAITAKLKEKNNG